MGEWELNKAKAECSIEVIKNGKPVTIILEKLKGQARLSEVGSPTARSFSLATPGLERQREQVE